LSSQEIVFPVEDFRARVVFGRLEVRARVPRSMGEYQRNFDYEVQSAVALCMALANFENTFSTEWSKFELHVRNEYGSQLRWKTAHSFTMVKMSRETLLELRKRNAPASAYPEHWFLFASKVGPPDYVYYEWSPGDQRNNSDHDGR
jgi:hypothetical protein